MDFKEAGSSNDSSGNVITSSSPPLPASETAGGMWLSFETPSCSNGNGFKPDGVSEAALASKVTQEGVKLRCPLEPLLILSPYSIPQDQSTVVVSVVADVLVGADGLRSAVRRYGFQRAKIQTLPTPCTIPHLACRVRDDRIRVAEEAALSKRRAAGSAGINQSPVSPTDVAPKPAVTSTLAVSSSPAVKTSEANDQCTASVNGCTASVSHVSEVLIQLPTVNTTTTSPLRYIGVTVILGLTTAEHPHIDQVWQMDLLWTYKAL